MPTTLEDLDRRLTALEKAAETEKNIIRAVSRVVSESEERTKTQIEDLQAETAKLRTQIENRFSGIEERIVTAQRETSAQINDFRQEVMAAFDKLHNPPK